MNNKYWIVDTMKDSHDHMLCVKEPDGLYSATIKWDGCVELRRYHNVPMGGDDPLDSQLVDGIHICDIADMIERLRALQQIAAENMPLFAIEMEYETGERQ